MVETTASDDVAGRLDRFESENLWLNRLIYESRDGIVVIDENCKVHEANKRFADMLGYSEEEIGRLHVWDWECLHSKDHIWEMVKTVDQSGQHFETRHRRKDGKIIDVELSNNGFIRQGKKLAKPENDQQLFSWCHCGTLVNRLFRAKKEKRDG